MHGKVRDLVKKFRVAEIFGPTIQGEGRQIGTPCHFIRFGGCDYRCTWCDSPHAVLPDLVSKLSQMTEHEIWNAVRKLPVKAPWVVLSGGNPALFDLSSLIAYLSGDGYSVMLETQGTVWHDWIGYIDEVCVSPKPPSSKNPTQEPVIEEFFSHEMDGRAYLKVVIFDDLDYQYAKLVHHAFPEYDFFVSAGTEVAGPTVGDPYTVDQGVGANRYVVLQKMTWLMEKVAGDREMRNVRVLPQMHVLAWGNQRGR